MEEIKRKDFFEPELSDEGLKEKEIFRRVKHFFEVDTRIKKEMYNMVPPNNQGYSDENSIIEYTNKLDDALSYMYTELSCIISDFIGPSTATKIEKMEKQAKIAFYSSGTDINKLREFYKNYVSSMNMEFIDSVKENIIGYYMFKDYNKPLNLCHTVNEYLHLCHSIIMNDEVLLKTIPLLDMKHNKSNYDISFRGEDVEEFRKVYDNFPMDILAGDVEMVALSDSKMIMMVRDRGHALTIETTLDKDNALVEYFIPKICNVEMTNDLPGINKVNDDSIGATGIFQIDRNTLPETLNDFISKVPTDLDIRSKVR